MRALFVRTRLQPCRNTNHHRGALAAEGITTSAANKTPMFNIQPPQTLVIPKRSEGSAFYARTATNTREGDFKYASSFVRARLQPCRNITQLRAASAAEGITTSAANAPAISIERLGRAGLQSRRNRRATAGALAPAAIFSHQNAVARATRP